MERVKAWLGPTTSLDKRRLLFNDGSSFTMQAKATETDVDGDYRVYPSHSPDGYGMHYVGDSRTLIQ